MNWDKIRFLLIMTRHGPRILIIMIPWWGKILNGLSQLAMNYNYYKENHIKIGPNIQFYSELYVFTSNKLTI